MVLATSNGAPHNSNTCSLKDKTPEEKEQARQRFKDKKERRNKKVQVRALQAELEKRVAELEDESTSDDNGSYDETPE